MQLWDLIDRPRTVLVTRKLAKQFMEMEPAPHDRPLSPRRLAVYEKLFKEGKFRPVTWATAVCGETGGTYRVNGKHTSTMLATMDFLPEFYVTIESYKCPTLEAVAQLYSTFDNKMMSRTATDIYMSFAATSPALKGLPTRIINNAVTGMAYAKGQQEMYKMQPAERAELLLEHTDFVAWFHDLMTCPGEFEDTKKGVKHRHLHILRQGVVAAMFKTWERDPKKAKEFWLEVRDETGITPDEPSRRVARFLLTTSMRSSMSNTPSSGKTQIAGLREVFVRCLHGWNAWRKGETTKLQYYPKAPVPTVA